MHFNTGSLDGDELVRQFIDVVTSYEMIGVKIYGMVSDGGGGNTNFFNMIADDKSLQGKWISKEYLRALNLVDTTRYIYIWSCSLYSLKTLINTLFEVSLILHVL